MNAGGLRKARGSIAVTFTLAVIAIFSVAQGILWFGFLFSQKELLRDHLESKAVAMVELISDVAALAIENQRVPDLQVYLDKVVRNEDIIKVKVMDDEGGTVAFASGAVEEQRGIINPYYIHWVNAIEEPVVVNDMVLGRVELIFSGKSVNDDMLDLLLLPPIAQAFVFMIVIFAIFRFTNSVLGKPIEILKERMVRVTSGDLRVDIPDVGSKEIREVADGLRFLIKGLSGNVQRLQSVTQSISVAIMTLKKTFKTSIDRVKSQVVSTNQIAGSMKLADESQGKMKGNAGRLSELINENLASVLEIKSREEEILESMEGLFNSVDNSYSVVAEMSQTSKVMMKNASRVLGSVENTSASVEEIIASVREVEASARESSQIADNVRTLAAQKGVGTVDRAITGMNRITDKVNTAVDIAEKLVKRSNDVQKILSIIKDITEKTNLLSINASILAEQAGEYGKGFTVVAEQMRSLSTSTDDYTKEISSIIKQIQFEIGDVVRAIKEGNDIVKEGSDAVYEVGETMSSILESSHASANMTKMIERATEDQVLALNHIETSIIDVNTMALEMDRAMGEMYKSSGFLFDSMSEVRDVAELTKNGSEELVKGVKSISHNLEVSSGGVKDIDEALTVQKTQSKDILTDVEAIRSEGVWIVKDLEELSESIENLKNEFDTLKGEMNMFVVE